LEHRFAVGQIVVLANRRSNFDSSSASNFWPLGRRVDGCVGRVLWAQDFGKRYADAQTEQFARAAWKHEL